MKKMVLLALMSCVAITACSTAPKQAAVKKTSDCDCGCPGGCDPDDDEKDCDCHSSCGCMK